MEESWVVVTLLVGCGEGVALEGGEDFEEIVF